MRGRAAGAATAAREAGSGATPGRSSLAVLSTPAGQGGGLWPAGGRRAAPTGVGVLRRQRRPSVDTCSKAKGGVEWAFKAVNGAKTSRPIHKMVNPFGKRCPSPPTLKDGLKTSSYRTSVDGSESESSLSSRSVSPVPDGQSAPPAVHEDEIFSQPLVRTRTSHSSMGPLPARRMQPS